MTVTDTALDLDLEIAYHMAKPDSVSVIQGEKVRVDVIEDETSAAIFEWQMEHIRQHGKIASQNVLEDEFNIIFEEPETAIRDLISRLRQRYVRNKGREVARDLAKLVNDDPLTVGKEMMRQGRLLADLTTKRGEVYRSTDIFRAMEGYNARILKGRGPSLGFKELDEHFHGIQGVTFVLAPPKTYKSWFTTNGVLENTLQGGLPYLYTLELPAEESDWRLRCMAANVPYWKYQKGCLTPEDLKTIENASEAMTNHGEYHVEKPPPGERTVARMVERALNAGATAIFFDQLQYMENRKGVNIGAANNTGDYWEVCNDLRDYSDEIPIFVVHQFNRSVMNAKEMPEPQQAKGSAAIEEVATLALGLWANKEMRANNTVQLGTLASRNYNYATWELGIQLSYKCEIEMIGEVEDDY